MYKSEDRILMERDKMLEELKSLRRETQDARDQLVEEKQKQKVVIEENLENLGTLVNSFIIILVA